MALMSPEFLRDHPVRAGLAWAVAFAPLFIAANLLTGMRMTPLWLTGVAAASVAGGVIWAFATRAVQAGRMDS